MLKIPKRQCSNSASCPASTSTRSPPSMALVHLPLPATPRLFSRAQIGRLHTGGFSWLFVLQNREASRPGLGSACRTLHSHPARPSLAQDGCRHLRLAPLVPQYAELTGTPLPGAPAPTQGLDWTVSAPPVLPEPR